MKLIFIYVIILVALNESQAQEIHADEAKNVGKNFLNTRTDIKYRRTDTDLKLVYKTTFAPHSFYIFNKTSNDGFVIVSGNKNTLPILAYSDQEDFDIDNVPPHVAQWLEDYEKEIRYLDENKIEPTETILKEWLSLRDGRSTSSANRVAQGVSPLLQTRWNQDSYYNAFCPQRSMTGCVATTMAQIMKYWNHPIVGTGSHSYYHKTYGELSVNFEETVYEWDKMPNSVKTKNDAVAILMYQCGVSVDMDYNLTGSAAFTISENSSVASCAEYAFKTYFDYKNSLRGIQRKNYSETQWTSLLKREIDAGRPVVYTAFNSAEGHTFICDGYDGNDYFHINWGWSGSYDGYFYINQLNPAKSEGEYAKDHQAIIGIEPEKEDPPNPGGIKMSDQVKVYPNPASDVISVSLQEFNGVIKSLTILDSHGKEILSTTVESLEKLELSTDELMDGLYVLRFESDKGSLSVKIVVNKSLEFR